jgi:hypothetical protein
LRRLVLCAKRMVALRCSQVVGRWLTKAPFLDDEVIAP